MEPSDFPSAPQEHLAPAKHSGRPHLRRRWTREEFERLGETGILGPEERVELIEGDIIEKAPPDSRQAMAIQLSKDSLRAVFGPGFDVRAQLPLALGPHSEPEPDIAVVPGAPRDYADAHPASALLVVEVADTTLAYDRDVKGRVYARVGIPDYWILNLVQRRLEVYRDPGNTGDGPNGFGYRTRSLFLPGDTVSPLARPDAPIAVADLLP